MKSLLLTVAAGPATTTAEAMQLELGLEPGVELRPGQAVAADRGLLIVLQAVNAGGKDGTIAEITSILGASQQIRVERFAKRERGSSVDEVMERASKLAPNYGELVFFNRGYHEELLAAVLDNKVDPIRIRGRHS